MSTAEQTLSAQSTIMTSPPEFTELYERYHATVYRAALRATGSPADAEDVLQTVFLRIFNQHGRKGLDQVSEAYFRRAATNAAVDLIRRRTSHPEVRIDENSAHAAGETPFLLKERLRRALASLDENDAVMFLLRYVEGLSNGELAEMFGLEKNHVAVRLHRIRQTLQIEMER